MASPHTVIALLNQLTTGLPTLSLATTALLELTTLLSTPDSISPTLVSQLSLFATPLQTLSTTPTHPAIPTPSVQPFLTYTRALSFLLHNVDAVFYCALESSAAEPLNGLTRLRLNQPGSSPDLFRTLPARLVEVKPATPEEFSLLFSLAMLTNDVAQCLPATLQILSSPPPGATCPFAVYCALLSEHTATLAEPPTASNIVDRVKDINVTFTQVMQLLKMEKYGACIDVVQKLLGATNAILCASTRSPLPATGTSSAKIDVPGEVVNELLVLSCESFYLLAFVYTTKYSRHADALKCLEKVSSYIDSQKSYITEVGGNNDASIFLQERKLVFVRASVQSSLLPDSTLLLPLINSDYFATVKAMMVKYVTSEEAVSSTEWKTLSSCIGRVLSAGWATTHSTGVDSTAHLATTTLTQLHSLISPAPTWTTAPNDFASIVVAELGSFVCASAVGDGGTTITRSIANYVLTINSDVLLVLNPLPDVAYKAIQSFEGVDELSAICIEWCERFLNSEFNAMTDSSPSSIKMAVDALSVKGYLQSCSDSPATQSEGMELLKSAIDQQPKAGACLFRFLKTTIKQLTVATILPWIDTLDSLLYNAQENGIRSSIALRLFEDVAHFSVNTPRVSTDVRASVLVLIMSKWLRVQCRPNSQQAGEDPQFSVFGLLKAMMAQLEIVVLSEASALNRATLVDVTMQAVDITIKTIVESTSMYQIGVLKDLVFISEQTWNLAVQVMATSEASDIFARAHDLHLLSSGCDTAGFLDLDGSGGGDLEERGSCAGSTEFSTMCLIVSVTAGLDHVERLQESKGVGAGEVAVDLESVKVTAALAAIMRRCDLLAISLKGCSNDFEEANEGFACYVTLTTLVLAKGDTEAAAYARAHSKKLKSFIADKFASSGDVAAVDSLLKKFQPDSAAGIGAKMETEREVLSCAMETIFTLSQTPGYQADPSPALQRYGRYALALLSITKALSSPLYSFESVCKDIAAKIISSPNPSALFSPTIVTSLCVGMYNASVRLAYCAGNDQKKTGQAVRECAASLVAYTDPDFRGGLGREVTASTAGAEEWGAGDFVTHLWGAV